MTDWRGGRCVGSELINKNKNLSLPSVGTPRQEARPGELALQRARDPSTQPGHVPPLPHLSCSLGPMEGQAVPTEPFQGCALTPTIHPNPPPLHPLQLLPPWPWHSACWPQPCRGHPPPFLGPSRTQATGRASAAQMQGLTRPLAHPCPLLWDLLLGANGLGTWVLFATGAADSSRKASGSSCSVTGRLYKRRSCDFSLGWDFGLTAAKQ